MSLSLLASTTLSPTSSNPLRGSNSKARPSVSSVPKRVAYTSCEQKQNKEGDSPVIDRRNVLLGLGGLYGAATTLGNQGLTAIGAPVQPPDLAKCHLATDSAADTSIACCPPYGTTTPIDFVPPSEKEVLRVRQPAHLLDDEYLAKFKEAIAKMKALPEDDPWSFTSQAKIHCAYCDGAYDQVGFDPAVLLQVHFSWLFLPWHRYYLYFLERILGKLIDDPTFALRFWNWDTPDGMKMPIPYYYDTSSSLYNDNRNKDHYTALVDYNYAYGDANPSSSEEEEVIIKNLYYLYSMFTESLNQPSTFMGKAVRAGETPSGAQGSCEGLHNVFHQWVGPTTSPYHDMGNFATAAYDMLFYAHHGNVDRMWKIFNDLRGNKTEFKDTDWLDATFVFYDENRQVVNCKTRDCLTPEQLRYTYQPQKLPWLDIRRRYKRLKAATKKSTSESESLVAVSEFGSEARALTSTIRALVKRPKTARSKDEKEEATEILNIEGIVVPKATAARFDVYITKPTEGLVGSDKGELVGSYVKVPHTHSTTSSTSSSSVSTKLELGINKVLEEIDAEASESVVVTLVPRFGDVTVGGLSIELVDVEE